MTDQLSNCCCDAGRLDWFSPVVSRTFTGLWRNPSVYTESELVEEQKDKWQLVPAAPVSGNWYGCLTLANGSNVYQIIGTSNDARLSRVIYWDALNEVEQWDVSIDPEYTFQLNMPERVTANTEEIVFMINANLWRIDAGGLTTVVRSYETNALTIGEFTSSREVAQCESFAARRRYRAHYGWKLVGNVSRWESLGAPTFKWIIEGTVDLVCVTGLTNYNGSRHNINVNEEETTVILRSALARMERLPSGADGFNDTNPSRILRKIGLGETFNSGGQYQPGDVIPDFYWNIGAANSSGPSGKLFSDHEDGVPSCVLDVFLSTSASAEIQYFVINGKIVEERDVNDTTFDKGEIDWIESLPGGKVAVGRTIRNDLNISESAVEIYNASGLLTKTIIFDGDNTPPILWDSNDHWVYVSNASFLNHLPHTGNRYDQYASGVLRDWLISYDTDVLVPSRFDAYPDNMRNRMSPTIAGKRDQRTYSVIQKPDLWNDAPPHDWF